MAPYRDPLPPLLQWLGLEETQKVAASRTSVSLLGAENSHRHSSPKFVSDSCFLVTLEVLPLYSIPCQSPRNFLAAASIYQEAHKQMPQTLKEAIRASSLEI